MKKAFYVYMITNVAHTVLYTGVTNNLTRRIAEHKAGCVKGFTQKYHVHRLVYFEEYDSIRTAIEREKVIKGWRRQKKNDLIATLNPCWKDLFKG